MSAGTPIVRESRLRQFLGLVKPYRWRLEQCLVVMLIMSGVAMVRPLLFARIIGRALPNQDLEILIYAGNCRQERGVAELKRGKLDVSFRGRV